MGLYYNSLPHQTKKIAIQEIDNANAPSIFDANDLLGKDFITTPNTTSTTNSSSTSSSVSVPISNTILPTQNATSKDLLNHENDSFAHEALYDRLQNSFSSVITAQNVSNTSVSANTANITGLSGTFYNFESFVTGTYLETNNLEIESPLTLTSGTDINGFATLTIGLDISKGIIVSGTINGIISSPLSAGTNYESGKIVTASLSNINSLDANHNALTLETLLTAASPIEFLVKSGYSGTSVNSSFDIHWMMI